MLKTNVMTSLVTASVFAMVAAFPALANERPTDVVVYDHTKRVIQSIPVTKVVCEDIKIPIYEEVYTQGDAAGSALLGMIIGGIAGKSITGEDDGAAAGAIIGGIIGADQGAKERIEQRVIGFEIVEQCKELTTYSRGETEVYSHSTIRFYLDGKRYVLTFEK